jgi:uncharacterized damage-inducible protein DinB
VHPRLVELANYAKAQRAELLSAVSLVPEPLRQHRAEAGGWSVAEVLEHLHRVERGIARLLVHSLERAKVEGIGPELETSSMMGSLDRFQLTRRGRPISAPEPVLPRGELSAAQAIAALTNSRQALLSALEAADGLALGAITYSHPLLGPLDLYQWVLFVGQHEARHAAQIHEIASRLQHA